MKTRLSITLKVVFFVVVAVLLAGGVHIALFVTRPASPNKEYRELLIPEGATFRKVTQDLKENGIISQTETFIILAKYMGVTRKIRAGFYSFDTSMKPLEVIDILKKGKIIEHQIVIPEGFDLMKVADTFEKEGLAGRDQFMAKATDPDYVKSLGLEGGSLEGYLFPATYFFPKGTSLDSMIKQMISKYRSVFNDSLKARAAELGMTELQVVTLASLVEREAKIDSERLLISAVFHNRLKKDMKLQCDPCIIYALQRSGRWTGDLTHANMKIKDPYNTYVYKGLPPGPIGNPGKPSIIAALYPGDVGYIFFVARNDGTHFFSTNLADHNRAVHQYQILAKMRNNTSVKPATAAVPVAAVEVGPK